MSPAPPSTVFRDDLAAVGLMFSGMFLLLMMRGSSKSGRMQAGSQYHPEIIDRKTEPDRFTDMLIQNAFIGVVLLLGGFIVMFFGFS